VCVEGHTEEHLVIEDTKNTLLKDIISNINNHLKYNYYRNKILISTYKLFKYGHNYKNAETTKIILYFL